MKVISICVIFTLIVVLDAVQKNYDNYKLYRVTPKTEDDVDILMDIQNTGIGEFWTEYFKLEDDVRVMVSPDNEKVFQNQMKERDMEATLIFGDLQEVIKTQNIASTSSGNFLSMGWDRYYNLEEINTWLNELARDYPNIVTVVTMGQSVEDREIIGIKIDYHPGRPDRKVGFLEGTLHAREWISPATITWIVKEFLTSTDPSVRALAEDLEWHIFPVVNPDGYAYTFTDNRMWRKNRSRANFTTCAPNVNDDMSNGVDLNRNFDFVWMTVGASNDSCTNTFAGPYPASEPETRAIAAYIQTLNDRAEIIYYLSFHSYTQVVIIPYSHVTSNQLLTADNYADMFEIAIRGAAKLTQRFGTTYRVGISADVLYRMSGSSFDWVKYNTNTKISYLIELRDTGTHGFLLPASQIIPNNLEIMDALIEMDITTRRLGYYSGRASGIVYSLSVIMFGLLINGFS